MSLTKKIVALGVMLNAVMVVGPLTGATLQNKICATFGEADGGRPSYCNAIICTNNASPVYCGGDYTNSYEHIAYEYDACVTHEGSQCDEYGSVTCKKIERHESSNCGDWFTCNSYISVTGCY